MNKKIVIFSGVTGALLGAVIFAHYVFGVFLGGNINMGGYKITNLGGNVPPDDVKFEAVNKGYVNSAIAPPSVLPNYLPKWDNFKALTRSNVYDSGSAVGVNMANPQYALDLGGAMRLQPGSAPTALEGAVYYDSSDKNMKYYDGTQWRNFSSVCTPWDLTVRFGPGGGYWATAPGALTTTKDSLVYGWRVQCTQDVTPLIVYYRINGGAWNIGCLFNYDTIGSASCFQSPVLSLPESSLIEYGGPAACIGSVLPVYIQKQ